FELGLRSALHRWFCSFLSNKSQRVCGPSWKLSEWSRITYGVPQGKVTQGLEARASESNMVINIQKCEAMHIFTLIYPDLTITDNRIPEVNSSKLLRVTVKNDLLWQGHINSVPTSAAKVLHIFYTLRKFDASPQQLITYYIRPILECCCPLLHAGLTLQQRSKYKGFDVG
ncbi:hypothetical protein Hamer_G003043, partial [Homarus americanus]